MMKQITEVIENKFEVLRILHFKAGTAGLGLICVRL